MKLFRTVLTVILSNSVLVKGHPRPEVSEVSEAMINDVLKSIRKVIENEKFEIKDLNSSNNEPLETEKDLSNSESEIIESFISNSISNLVKESKISTSTTKAINTSQSTTTTISTTNKSSTTTTKTPSTTTSKKSSTTDPTTTSSTTATSLFDILANHEETDEEVLCDTIPNNSLLRNGLGSTGFTWPNGKIPYTIDDGFNATQKDLIKEAVNYYNKEFSGCIEWIEKSG